VQRSRSHKTLFAIAAEPNSNSRQQHHNSKKPNTQGQPTVSASKRSGDSRGNYMPASQALLHETKQQQYRWSSQVELGLFNQIEGNRQSYDNKPEKTRRTSPFSATIQMRRRSHTLFAQ
jgi:hypothetical protein